jgi:hypothetical protein
MCADGFAVPADKSGKGLLSRRLEIVQSKAATGLKAASNNVVEDLRLGKQISDRVRGGRLAGNCRIGMD